MTRVIDDGLGPGDAPDDSPWRPGADVRFDHPPIRPFVEQPGRSAADFRTRTAQRSGADPASAESSAAPDRRRGSALAFVAVLALVGVATVLRSGDRPPSGGLDTSVGSAIEEAAGARSAAFRDLGGDVILSPGDVPLATAEPCPTPRLPTAVDPLWSAEIPGVREIVEPVTVGGDSVVAVAGFDDDTADGLGSAAVVALDLDDGRERWRAVLQPATGRHEIVGVVDRAVIVRSAAGPDMAYRRLFAFDEVSGAVLWDRGFRGEWSANVQPATGLVYVGVRRPAVSATEESEVEVLDPRTGDRLHIAAGAFIGLDPDGRLITRIGDKVLATSIEDRDLLGVVVPSDSPFAVVGSRVVVADRVATELDVFSGSGDGRPVPLVGRSGLDAPGFVVSLDSIGGSSLLVHGDGAVHGAVVGNDTVEIRWRLTGVVLESAATDRGRSLLVATEGGARQRVVDSSTGRTIVDLEFRPGTFATLALVANGVVVQDSVEGEPARVALDLDGRELWSLPGSGAFAVGNGVVVDVDDADAVVGVYAWGEPDDSRIDAVGCRSVMTEWIPR